MRRSNKASILERLEIVFKEAKPAAEFKPDTPGRLFMSKGIAFMLVDTGLKAFDESVDEILQDKLLADNFSKQYVENALRDLVATNLGEYSEGKLDIKDNLDKKIEELRQFSRKHTVMIPLGGIDFKKPKKLVIGKVSIGKFRGISLEVKTLLKSEPIAAYLKNLEGKVVASVEMSGETIRAQEKALDEIGTVLNVLRFYVRAFRFRSTDVQIRTMPEIALASRMVTLIDKHHRILHPGLSRAGIFLFTVDAASLKKMRTLHLGVIDNILKKPTESLTEFEKKLILAINWYGTAVDMTAPVLKFINYAIVIEVLLSKQEKDSDRTITESLSEGVAFLLGRGYENKAAIKKRMKELYGIRSAVVHGGRNSVPEKDLREIELTAYFLLLNLLGKIGRFRTKAELLRWVEKMRLS